MAQWSRAFDERRGGFGDAPKFPRPSELLLLLREHARTGAERPRTMALGTLRAMALGGMRDHVGGGFHRYSVDGDWRVPHFEKMLYDQAQLVLALLEAGQVSGDPFFAQVAEDTLRYVARDLTSPDGAFYSAEDADSVPPAQAGQPAGHATEGAFYIWSRDEIVRVLGPDAAVWERRFGVLPGGNAPFDPHGDFAGHNLFYTARTIADIAQETGLQPAAVGEALARGRQRLFEARAEPPPAAARRQGAGVVERTDDRRMRPGGSGPRRAGSAGRGRAGNRGAASGCRAALRRVHPRAHVERHDRPAAAPTTPPEPAASTPLPRTTRIWPGDCSSSSRPTATRPGSTWARAAPRDARPRLRRRRRRRVVRHDRRGSVGAAPAARGIRRRRAGGDARWR